MTHALETTGSHSSLMPETAGSELHLPEPLRIAEVAFGEFAIGLATGDWTAFVDRLSEDFRFWFPAGPFKGWNQGRDRAIAFFSSVSQVFPEGLTLTLSQITHNETTVVFEVQSRGKMLGHDYENQAAIAFEVRDSKIVCYREYLGVIYQLQSLNP